jgi:DNA-binding transcriptional MocR family regulator
MSDPSASRAAADWSTHYARRIAGMRGSEVSALLALLARTDIISFAGGIPDPTLFPIEALRTAYDAILGDPAQAARALQYSVPEGDPGLRAWIAEDMRRLGVTCTAENVLITSGSQQGLDFLGKLLVSPGDRILISRPTFLGALQAFNSYEPDYGQSPLVAPAEARGAKFAYVMPDFDNPTGRSLNLAERRRLLDIADDSDLLVIEDSPYETLRYDGEAVPSLLALSAERTGDINRCRTIFLGSFSKSIAPGFRIGWMVGPRDPIAQLALIKQASDIQVSTINQMVMHAAAPAILPVQAARVRPIYRARRDAMLRSLEAFMPRGVSWTRPEGGFFIWLTLPPAIDTAALLPRAVEEAKVAFVPGGAFFPDRSSANTLRLSFSLASPEATEAGIARLGGLITETLRTG